MDNVPEHFYNRLEIRGLHFFILNSQNYKITETGLQHVTPQSVCTPVREWSEDHFFIFFENICARRHRFCVPSLRLCFTVPPCTRV